MQRLSRYDLYKLRLPLGREIGDNMCHYSAFNVCVLRLETADGLVGWGYGEKVADGHFAKDASWNRPMPPVEKIRKEFESVYWPVMQGESVHSLKHRQPSPFPGDSYLELAIRFALWDLIGKASDLPLYRYLGAPEQPRAVLTTVCGCEFPQPIEWVLEFLGAKLDQGVTSFKIKVGHDDPQWDLDRLIAIRDRVGPDVELGVDANIAWKAPQALEWLELINRKSEAINLQFLEDPLAPDDLAGYELLAKECPIPIVGHDYMNDTTRLRPLLDTGAISRLRVRDGLDYGLQALGLAEEYDLPLDCCNTFLEVGLHFALACPRVERIEFADLGWNALPRQPVQLIEGHLLAPDSPGHGLAPNMDILNKYISHE